MLKHPSNPIYNAWNMMKQRCYNPNATGYENYGGRGIEVCLHWRNSFEAFYADMSPTWFKGATLDRKKNNGHYTPKNCQWATHRQQQRNTRANRFVAIDGIRKSVMAWSEETGIRPDTIKTRIRRGWAEDRLLQKVNPNYLR